MNDENSNASAEAAAAQSAPKSEPVDMTVETMAALCDLCSHFLNAVVLADKAKSAACAGLIENHPAALQFFGADRLAVLRKNYGVISEAFR